MEIKATLYIMILYKQLYSQREKLKNILLALVAFLFIGCNGNQPIPKNNNVKKVECEKSKIEKEQPKEEYEKTISYQDIIMKINDINTNKKTNKRVKNIVKEYQYNVSDDDSKNSARKKALTQVKILILEEIGVFVESYLELSTVVENKKYQKYFKEEIKNLTAGIIKTKIIDEKFDGKSYYVKASVLVDPDSVSEGISEILKIKANKGEIKKLNKLLQTKEQEIDMRSSETISLQKKIANQSLLNQAKAKELLQTQQKLSVAESQLKKYQLETSKINNRLDTIKNIIKSKTNKAMTYLERGMTYREMISLAGKPRSSGEFYYEKAYNYGAVWVQFTDGVIGCIVKFSGEKTKCSYYGKNSAYPPYSMLLK